MSTLSQMGIPGVGTGYLHPKHRNKWRLTFLNMGSGANTADLSMQVVTTTRPNLSFEEVPIHRYTTTAYVAGKYTWDPLNVTVEDDVTGLASAVIGEQQERQQKLIGADGPWMNTPATASAYKFGAKLEMLDGNETVLEEWILEGCWLSAVDRGDLDYQDSSAVTITLTIRFDHARNVNNKHALGTAIGGNVAN